MERESGESRVEAVLAGMERESLEIRVDSLEAALKLAERKGKEHGVLVFICAVDGVHHARYIADALGDLKETNNWEVINLGVVEALSSLYEPLFLSYGSLEVIMRHRHDDNGLPAVKEQARQLLLQVHRLKSMELSGITGAVFGQVPHDPVPQAGRAMGDRIVNLCKELLGEDAEHRTKRKKLVSDYWFVKVDKLFEDIELFMKRPVHLPAAPDAASGQDESLPAATAADAEVEHFPAAPGSASDQEEHLPRRRRRLNRKKTSVQCTSATLPHNVPDVTPK